jgi:hypothetical protein
LKTDFYGIDGPNQYNSLFFGYILLWMQKLFRHTALALFIIVTISGCKKNKQGDQLNWSNSRLLEIPAKVRMQQYTRGNLLPNPSFEERKVLRVDSLNVNYNVLGWKKEGPNIRYLDLTVDNSITEDEVTHGTAAYKFSRKHANEYRENGEGITSDFIKVIPGMYDLFMDVKCIDIRPYQSRLSEKLLDAIDIRVLYFDKNKLSIPGPSYHPFRKLIIDNSFKGIGFNHFTHIDSSGWMRIKAVSGYYPYNESVIPDEARFVKIYIGMKGTGVLYVDNIQYLYSKENLTPRERARIYFDSITNPIDYIIPKPQSISFIDSVTFFQPDSGLYLEPFILTGNNVGEKAVALVQEKLLSTFAASIYKFDIREIKVSGRLPDKYAQNALVISIGETELFQSYRSKMQWDFPVDQKDAYVVDFIQDTIQVLFVYAISERGYQYACGTVQQLFSGFKLYAARIIDFPDYSNRGVFIDNELLLPEFIEMMGKYRINNLFKPGGPLKPQPLIDVNPVIKTGETVNWPGNQKKVAIFSQTGCEALNVEGIQELAKRHTAEIQRLSLNNTEVFFKTPFSHNTCIEENPVLCQFYFNQLSDFENLHILWFGHDKHSQYVDGLSSLYFTANTGLKPSYVDHFQDAKSPSINLNPYYNAYPEKIPMANLYDPYDNLKMEFGGKDVYMYLPSTDIFSVFRLATFGEYAWNPDGYDPDYALFKVLVNEFGMENARYFYYFNDAYCGLLSTIRSMLREGSNNRTIKSAENEIIMLNVSFEEIKKRLPHRTDIIDMMFFSKRMLVNRYNTVYEKVIVNKKMKADSAVTSNF